MFYSSTFKSIICSINSPQTSVITYLKTFMMISFNKHETISVKGHLLLACGTNKPLHIDE